MKTTRSAAGFSLIELLIVVALLSIVIGMTTDTFSVILRQSRGQTRIAETQIESIMGLEMLRADLEAAGFGLPWQYQNAITYEEATEATPSTYNDKPSGVPRAVVTGNNTGLNNSDYLVIKSTSVARSDAAHKWTYMIGGSNPKTWSVSSLNLATNDKVIVIRPTIGGQVVRRLVMNSGAFSTEYKASKDDWAEAFKPNVTAERHVIYGLLSYDPDKTAAQLTIRMPFNRVDYYINVPSSGLRSTCAPGTGNLYRATVNQGDGTGTDGGELSELPVLDCVADMQIVFRLDSNGDGAAETTVQSLSGYSAAGIREQLKEIAVYILSQEDAFDSGYRHDTSVITVGPSASLGSQFDLATRIGSNWMRYRWKVHTLVIKPRNLT